MGSKKRPSRQDAATVGRGEGVTHAAAVRVASRWVCLDGVVAEMDMVSTEMDAGNEKPRAGAGAGSLIESGFFRLRASSSRTCGLGNNYEYKQRGRSGGRARRQVGGGVALQHGSR